MKRVMDILGSLILIILFSPLLILFYFLIKIDGGHALFWHERIGQMSLVGPRPIIKDELPYYKDDVDYYLMVKPGMTGLWQVSGRMMLIMKRGFILLLGL